jgi:hypothetical protein
LDNGEWYWSLYAVTIALENSNEVELARRYRGYVECQKQNAKRIFYRGNGDVSAVAYILDAFAAPSDDNYKHADGYLNDPYEGETLTQILYLYSDWESEEEREMLWEKKRGLFQAANYTIPMDKALRSGLEATSDIHITVQVTL